MSAPQLYVCAHRVAFHATRFRHAANDAFDTLLIQAVRVRSNDNPGPEAA